MKAQRKETEPKLVADEGGIRRWLTRRGFDPDLGTLSTPNADPRRSRKFLHSTAMFEAAHGGQLEVCRFLWAHGAAETVRVHNNDGCTPMWAASLEGHLDVMKWLFASGAADDIRTKASNQWTPVYAACEKGHLDAAKWLFGVGAAADVRTANVWGRTPLFAACYRNHLPVAMWLFAAGAAGDLCTPTSDGVTPLHVAGLYGHLEVAEWLLLAGAASGGAIVTSTTCVGSGKNGKISSGASDGAKNGAKNGAGGEGTSNHVAAGDDPSNGSDNARRASNGASETSALDGGGGGDRSDSGGHVDPALLLNALTSAAFRVRLRESLHRRVHDHGKFTALVLAAVHFGSKQAAVASPSQLLPAPEAAMTSKTAAPEAAPEVMPARSAEVAVTTLQALRGHEDSLLMLIADFSGVIRGRQLRIAREAMRVLL